MKPATIAALAVISSLLGGCATNAITASEATWAPESQVFYQSVDTPDAATVLFVRDTGFIGGGVYHHVSINEVRAASLNPGEKVELKLAPGEYLFSVLFTDPLKLGVPSVIEQRVDARGFYQYRIAFDSTGNSRLIRTLGK